MPLPEAYSLRALDVTFLLFAFADLVVLLISAITTLDANNSEGWGMLLGPTIGLAAFVAALCGMVAALRQWRYRPLLLLGVCSILVLMMMPISIAFEGSTRPASRGAIILFYLAEALSLTCMAIVVLVPFWWFIRGRRRYRGPLLSNQTTAHPRAGIQ